MFEITSVPETDRCICLSPGPEGPVEVSVDAFPALYHAKQKIVGTLRVLKRNTGTFPNDRFSKQ